MTTAIAMRLKTSERGWNEGATAVETALVISVLMLLLFGVIGFGYALWQWNTMMLAVEQAGRYVMINYNNGCNAGCAVSQMQTVLTSASSCNNPKAGQMCVSATPILATTPPTMTLTSAYNLNLIPLIPSFTMTTQTVVPLD
jgi:Flp pilus assembly protein TadG